MCVHVHMYCASGSMADDRWPDGRWPDGRWPDGRWSSSKPQSCAVVMAHICAHMQVHAHTCTCVHLTGGRLPMAACPTTTHRSKCRMHRTLPSSYRPHHCFKRQAIKVAQCVTASGACTCGRCERACVRACARARTCVGTWLRACVRTRVGLPKHVYIHACLYTCPCTCLYACLCGISIVHKTPELSLVDL